MLTSLLYAYPVLLWLHIVALIVWCGAMAVTDLRLLGFVLKTDSVAEVIDGLRWPKRHSFAVAAICGALLFVAKAGEYSYNPGFWIKIGLLVLLAGNYLILRRSVSGRMKLAGSLSLILWIGAIWASR